MKLMLGISKRGCLDILGQYKRMNFLEYSLYKATVKCNRYLLIAVQELLKNNRKSSVYMQLKIPCNICVTLYLYEQVLLNI